MPWPGSGTRSNSHSVAARGSCTTIPLASGEGSGGRDHSPHRLFPSHRLLRFVHLDPPHAPWFASATHGASIYPQPQPSGIPADPFRRSPYHFFSQAGGAVISGDLEQDPDVHGAPPLLIARERVSHNGRSGKPKRVQHKTRSSTLPHLGPRQPSVCTPEKNKQIGILPPLSVLLPPSLPSSSARAWTTPRARPCSKPPESGPACVPRPNTVVAWTG